MCPASPGLARLSASAGSSPNRGPASSPLSSGPSVALSGRRPASPSVDACIDVKRANFSDPLSFLDEDDDIGAGLSTMRVRSSFEEVTLRWDISRGGGEVRSVKDDIGVTNGGVSSDAGSSVTTAVSSVWLKTGISDLRGVRLPEPLGVVVRDL